MQNVMQDDVDALAQATLIHTQAFCKKLSWNNVTPEGHKVCVIEYILS